MKRYVFDGNTLNATRNKKLTEEQEKEKEKNNQQSKAMEVEKQEYLRKLRERIVSVNYSCIEYTKSHYIRTGNYNIDPHFCTGTFDGNNNASLLNSAKEELNARSEYLRWKYQSVIDRETKVERGYFIMEVKTPFAMDKN